MYTTRQVIRALRDGNPESRITEEQIRHALRRESIPAPTRFGGRFAWTADDIRNLAAALEVHVDLQDEAQTP